MKAFEKQYSRRELEYFSNFVSYNEGGGLFDAYLSGVSIGSIARHMERAPQGIRQRLTNAVAKGAKSAHRKTILQEILGDRQIVLEVAIEQRERAIFAAGFVGQIELRRRKIKDLEDEIAVLTNKAMSLPRPKKPKLPKGWLAQFDKQQAALDNIPAL